MATLRLLADDLTGALDSAARFVPWAGAVPVYWDDTALPATAAIDSGTRDLGADGACAIIERLAPALQPADIAFKKIDSLLRGHVAAELAICMRHFDHCILAPAFPYQGRITRKGRQLRRDADAWHDTGVDLAAALRQYGVTVPVRDAETDDDLAAIVAEGRALSGRVLWCGTGGLAGALAGRGAVPMPDLPRPILALIGSDHPVSATQLAAVGRHLHRVAAGHAEVTAVHQSLEHGAAAMCVALPDGTPRSDAMQRIVACFVAALEEIPPTGTLVISGGETLRALCAALGVTHLLVDGEVVPGVPTSILRGGPRDGQRIVSKSGAFGDAGFLARLLARTEKPRPT
jgi:uncharacterized protein YgbK (DUF1537 family)